MQTAVRPFASAGVALIGATAIAMTPVVAPTISTQIQRAEAQVEQVAVQLSAAANPLTELGDLVNGAIANLQQLVTLQQDNGATPILTAFLNNALTTAQDALNLIAKPGSLVVNPAGTLGVPFNSAPTLLSALGSTVGQIGSNITTVIPPLLKTAITDLFHGDVEDFTNNLILSGLNLVIPVTNLLTPALNAIAYPLQAVVNLVNKLGPIGAILDNPLQNVVNVLNTLGQGFSGLAPSNLETVVGGLLGPIIEAPAAMGVAAQNVINQLRTGNIAGTISAILSAPITVLNGIINGGIGPDLSSVINTGISGVELVAGGILSTFGITFGGTGALGLLATLPGPVAAIQDLIKFIASALKPPALTKPVVTTPAAAATNAAALPAASATTVALSAAATKAATKKSTTKADDSTKTDSTTADTSTKTDSGKGTDSGKTADSTSGTSSSSSDSATSGTDSSSTDSSTGTKGHGKGGKNSSSSSTGSDSTSSTGKSGKSHTSKPSHANSNHGGHGK